MEKDKNFKNEIAWGLANTIITILCVCCVYQLWDKDFSVPIVYNGDGTGALVTIRKVVEHQNLWDYKNLTAPYGEKIYSQDYLLAYMVIKIIALFTSDIGYIANIFWILSYVLTAISCYIFLRKLHCNNLFSLLGSLLYNFLPYHYFKVEHFWLMGLYIIPLTGILVVNILEMKEETEKRKNIVIFLKEAIISILIGLNGVYYSFFSILVLGIAILYICFYHRVIKAVKHFCGDTLFIIIPIIIGYLLPLVMYGEGEMNEVALGRSVTQINDFGLSLFMIFLPIPGHRVPILGRITESCFSQMNVSTESFAVSLGIFMSIGLLLSVYYAFRKKTKEDWEIRISEFGILNICIFIIATIGGIDNAIAIFVSANMRCYNRLIVFIALFSVASLMIFIQNQIIEKYKIKKVGMLVIGLCIGIIGVLDQTSASFAKNETYDIVKRQYVYKYKDNEKKYWQDQEFFKTVAELLDDEKMLYLAPNNSKGDKSYDDLKIYLSGYGISTSYSVYDMDYIQFWNKISQYPFDTQIKVMSIMGFSGIVIDENGFASKEKYMGYIEKIEKYADEESEIWYAEEGLQFYSFKDWKKDYLQSLTSDEKEKLKIAIQQEIYGNIHEVDKEKIFGLNENKLKKDTIQFGPYINLEKGEYQVLIKGKNLSGTVATVTTDKGKNRIEVKNEKIQDDYIQYDFSLDQSMKDVEFTLFNSEEDVEIEQYFYKKIGAKNGEYSLKKQLDLKEKLYEKINFGEINSEIPINNFQYDDVVKINQIEVPAGTLQYGPYYHCDAGNYQIEIEGQGLKKAEPMVTSDIGEVEHKIEIVYQSDEKIIYVFKLYESTDNIEFKLKSSEDMVISKYNLIQKQ